MAKKPSITNIATGYQATDTINDNFVNVRDAFDNTLSRDGSTPNAMGADLDLDSHDILNAKDVYAENLYLSGSLISGGSLSDGNYGDITVSSGGTVWTINAGSVTYNMLDSTTTSAFAAAVHTHDDRYYTESEVTSFLAGKADTSHTHSASDVTSGTLPIARGGTGVTGTPTNGQLLIGNGSGYTLNTISAGANVTITNTSGGITIAAATTGGSTLADGDYGDVTVSSSGTIITIDSGVVETSNLGGDITTAGKALLDDADAAAQRSTLGLGTAATENTTAFAAASHTHAISDITNLQSTLDDKANTSSIVGQQTIWIPASAMYSRTTNGAASGTIETSTNKVMLRTLDFDTSTQEFAQFNIQMPKSWNRSTLICQFVWTHPTTTTNFGVVWAIEAVAFANDDAADTAFGTAVQVSDTGGTANDIYITDETSALTVSGSPGNEEWVVFQIKRVPEDGSDTMAVDARLLGVKIHYTTNAATDD